MRDPSSVHSFYEYSDQVPDVIVIPDLPPCDIPDYDLNDEKSFKKYIFDIEKVVRNSHEYRKMVNYLRDYMDMNKCSFFEAVSNADSPKIRIEIHHEPLTLHDYVTIVYNKRVAFHESLEIELVAKEVAWLHYAMRVGLIPLSETVHELVHNQYLFVPSTKVYGHYQRFVQDYGPFMDLEQRDTLERIEQMSLVYDQHEHQQILTKKFIYVDATGSYKLPSLQEVSAMLKGEIRRIMDNPVSPQQTEVTQTIKQENEQVHSTRPVEWEPITFYAYIPKT